MIDCVKVQPHLLVFNSATIVAFLHFLDPSELFLVLESVSKTFLGPAYVDNQFWFGKHSPNYLSLIRSHLGLFCTFFLSFGAMFVGLFGAIFGVGIMM